MSEGGLTAIATDYHWTGRHDRNGNLFRFKGKATMRDALKPIYDIFFRTVIEN